jgi:hypothetical protein
MVDNKYKFSFKQLLSRIDTLTSENIPKNYIEVKKKYAKNDKKKNSVYENSVETR